MLWARWGRGARLRAGALLTLLALGRGAAAQDCNVNGVADATDVAGGASLDCQGDGVPDECDLFPLSYAPDATALGTTPGALDVDSSLGGFVAVTSLTDDAVTVFQDVGDGELTLFDSAPVGARPEAVLVRLLRSGIIIIGGGPEIVTANANDGTVSVLAAGFSGYADVTGSPFAVGGAPNGLAAADLTLDDEPEILVTDRTGGEVHVLVNDGSGGWFVGGSFATGANPRAIVTGDFDRDGDADALVGARTPGEVVLLENNAGLSFLPAAVAYAVGDPLGLAVADVDADGTLDLAVLSATEQAVHVLSNDGSAGFSLLGVVPVGAQPFDVRLADLDGNGTPDLVVPTSADDAVTLALNRGDGTFEAPVGVPAGDGPVAAGAIDFDLDGRVDLLTADVLGESVTLLRAAGGEPDCDGGGVPDACELADDDCDASGVLDTCEKAGGRGFAAPVASPAPSEGAASGGDFDEDGFGDVLMETGDGVTFFRGQADGSLAEVASFATGMGTRDVVLVDVDADGHLDVVVSNNSDDTVSVLRGDGTGSIAGSSLHGVAMQPDELAVADLDRDGDLDVAVRDASTGLTASLLLQEPGGGFASGGSVAFDSGGGGLASGDADGDGHVDLFGLVQLPAGTSAVQVVRNDGGGTLTPLAPILETIPGERIFAFAAGDLQGMGEADLVLEVVDLLTGVVQLRVALNDGAGAYAVSQALPVAEARSGGLFFLSSLSARIGVLDVDADGDADVVLPGGAALRVHENDGTGTLGLGRSVPFGEPSFRFAASDVDGDGAGDLVVPTRNGLLTLRSLALPAEAVCFGACLTAAAESCIELERARLTIKENKVGREKWKLSLQSPQGPVPAGFFGDPAGGTTRVDVCLYDDLGVLVGELAVDRAGDVCGPRAKPCWKAKGATSFTYKDPVGDSSGVRKAKAKSRSSSDAKLSLQAGNRASRGETALPVGVAAALTGVPSARVQVLTTDGACFDAALPDVKRADGAIFQARAP